MPLNISPVCYKPVSQMYQDWGDFQATETFA
jgi:hypothetical protein